MSGKIQNLIEITDELKCNTLSKLHISKEQLSATVDVIMEWFRQQPHLPKIEPDSKYIEQLIIGCAGDIKRVQNGLDMYYTLKTAAPEIFSNRDPLSDDIRYATQGLSTCIPYPVTSAGQRIICFQFLDSLEFLNINNFYKFMFMMLDMRMRQDSATNVILVIDMEKLKLEHKEKLSSDVIQKGLVAGQVAYIFYIKEVHFVNSPLLCDDFIYRITSFIESKNCAQVFVHKTLKSLHKYIDKSRLPKDFGGKQKSINKIRRIWYAEMINLREWFLEEDRHITDESQRPGELLDIFSTSRLIK